MKETIITSLILVAIMIITAITIINNVGMQKRLLDFESRYSQKTETAIPMPEWIHYVKAPTTA